MKDEDVLPRYHYLSLLNWALEQPWADRLEEMRELAASSVDQESLLLRVYPAGFDGAPPESVQKLANLIFAIQLIEYGWGEGSFALMWDQPQDETIYGVDLLRGDTFLLYKGYYRMSATLDVWDHDGIYVGVCSDCLGETLVQLIENLKDTEGDDD